MLQLLPLLALVALCFVLVALAAQRASLLSPTATAQHYPSWLAGPLRGAWLGNVPSTHQIGRLVSGAFAALFLVYLLVLGVAKKVSPGWILAAVGAVQLILLLSPPLEYTDVFNYINYGRMGIVHHLDPYTTLPVSEPHSDPAYALSNWHNLRSPYGPLFTLFSYALVPLGVAVSLWALKLIVGLCSVGLLALVWRLARRLGRSPQQAVAFVGLNPIVLVWGLGGEHNDFIMVLLVFAAFYLLIRTRLPGTPSQRLHRASAYADLIGPELLAGILLVAAVGIKISAVIFLPVAVAIARRRLPLVLGVAGAGALLVAVSLLAFGPHLGGVHAQTTLVSPEGLPNLLGILLGLGGATTGLRDVLTVVSVLVILLAAAHALRRPAAAIECACVSALAAILTLGWSAPWYVLWALPFGALALSRRWRSLLLVYTLYALVMASPNIANIESALHFYPRADRLGREHVREFDYLGAR